MIDFKIETEQKLAQVLELIKTDLSSIKTGRAKPALVEHLKVEAYPGTILELRELASISAPDTNQLLIKPWDQNILGAIEKAVAKSDLGNPIVDNDLIRIKIPALTGERREELVKLVHQKLESGRVLTRQVRTEIKEKIEAQKGQAGVSEDDIHCWLEDLQKLINDHIKQLEELGKVKEAELRQI